MSCHEDPGLTVRSVSEISSEQNDSVNASQWLMLNAQMKTKLGLSEVYQSTLDQDIFFTLVDFTTIRHVKLVLKVTVRRER